MLMRAIVLLSVLFLFFAAPARACSAEFGIDQCDQMRDDGGDSSGGSQNSAGGGCPYYMCGNAMPSAQSAVQWCEATQTWTNCVIGFCAYAECSGYNCYVTSETCSVCSSLQGNNAHGTPCPRN